MRETLRDIFVSYARADRAIVDSLVVDLHELGHSTFYDHDLVGGQRWWDTLLDQIQSAECFIPVLSDAFRTSEACQAEAEWAASLGIPFLPISVQPQRPGMFIEPIAETNWVSYEPAGRASVVALARGLASLPSVQAPEELPQRPPIPVSYLIHLEQEIRGPADLSRERQLRIVSDLRSKLATGDADGARELLIALRLRPEVTHEVAETVDTLLASSRKSSRGHRDRPMPTPRPRAASPGPTPPVRAVEGSTNGRRRRWWLVAVAVVLVAVAATVTTVLLRDRSDREPVTSAAVFATGLSDSTVNEGDDVSVPVLTNAAAGQHVATTLHGALPRGLRLTNGTIAGTVAPTASTATKSFDITHTNPTFGSTVYSFSIEARTPDHAPTSRTLSWTVKDTELRVPDYDGTTPKSSDPLFPYRIFHVTDANACVRDHTIVGTVYRQSLRLNIPVQYGASLTLWYAADTGTCNNNISPGYGR